MRSNLLEADEAILSSLQCLYEAGVAVDAGHWQGYETKGRPDLMTRELLNLTFSCQIPATSDSAAALTRCSMPWAEEEFNERVGGTPHNPHQSLPLWPWWNNQIETPFTHTYSERFWPTRVGVARPAGGLRYAFGDLGDVIELLHKYPHTRQATLPIFFPEDTGAVHGGRIPCTLSYHFLLRGDSLHMWYAIRSCDAVRHFRDDVYMAMRLCQWVVEQLMVRNNDYEAQEFWEGVAPGVLNFTAYSFHAHAGDWRHLEEEVNGSVSS